MKKQILPALILCLSLAGCSSRPETPQPQNETQFSYVPVVSSVGSTQENAEAASGEAAEKTETTEIPPVDEPKEEKPVYIPPKFSVSATDTLQGDAIAVRVTMNSAEGIPEIKSKLGDAHFMPAGVEGDYLAIVPIWYAQEPGKYNLTVKAGVSEMIFPITVGKAEFIEQHMTISSSTVASTTGDKANADYAEKVKAQFNTFDEEKYWHGTFIQPVEARVSTQFGLFRYTNGSKNPTRHTGIDLAAPAGTPVPASNAGRVVFAGEVIKTGNTVIIEHGGGLKTYYFHLSEIDCEADQMVEQGDIIGLVGSTGYSTGAHLHFEVRIGQYAISPWGLFDGSSSFYQWENSDEN